MTAASEQTQLHDTYFKNLCLKSPFEQNKQVEGKQSHVLKATEFSASLNTC